MLSMHLEDASRRGIAAGDEVRVQNGRGGCVFTAGFGAVKRGVVSSPVMRRNKLLAKGSNLNALTTDGLTDIGQGAGCYSCSVQVEKTHDT